MVLRRDEVLLDQADEVERVVFGGSPSYLKPWILGETSNACALVSHGVSKVFERMRIGVEHNHEGVFAEWFF
jgi:hypothetical protein